MHARRDLPLTPRAAARGRQLARIAPLLFIAGVMAGFLAGGMFWFAYEIPTWFRLPLILPLADAVCSVTAVPLVASQR